MGRRVGQEQDVLLNKIGPHHFDLAGLYKGENAHSAYFITFLGGLLHPTNSQEVHRRLTGQLSHQVRKAPIWPAATSAPTCSISSFLQASASPSGGPVLLSACLKLDFSSTPLPAALRPKRSIQQIFGSWLTSAEQRGLELGDIADQQVTWWPPSPTSPSQALTQVAQPRA